MAEIWDRIKQLQGQPIRGDRFNTSYVHAILCAIGMAV